MCCLLRGGILPGYMAFPRFAEDFGTERFGDFIRLIVHIVVEHDNDFACPPGNALEREADALRFVAGNHADGNG